jgi:hypothetical protein
VPNPPIFSARTRTVYTHTTTTTTTTTSTPDDEASMDVEAAFYDARPEDPGAPTNDDYRAYLGS